MIQKLRISFLISVHILILLHIFYWGDNIVGSIDFQEFFHSFIKHGIINAGVLLVIFSFLFTLIFGRFFCGWACHFGAIQEFCWYIFQKINSITPHSNDFLTASCAPSYPCAADFFNQYSHFSESSATPHPFLKCQER